MLITRPVRLALWCALAVVLSGDLHAEGKRQFYSGWQKHPRGDYYYTRYNYKPSADAGAYLHHYVIWTATHPKYCYCYNPQTRTFYGRWDVAACGKEGCHLGKNPHGYYAIAKAEQKPTIAEIPETAFSPRSEAPRVPADAGNPAPATPPATDPPAAGAPPENPPANPPAGNPPATNPPASNPPAADPPAANPPAANPPAASDAGGTPPAAATGEAAADDTPQIEPPPDLPPGLLGDGAGGEHPTSDRTACNSVDIPGCCVPSQLRLTARSRFPEVCP